MHILYLHQHFALPSGSTGTRSYEMARRWVRAGHRVTLICGITDQSGIDAGMQKVMESDVEGIRILALNTRYSNSLKFCGRVWVFIKFIFLSFWIGLKVKDVDVIYATSTPLTIGIPAMLLKWFKRVAFIFEIRDQWPEIPIEMGIIKNPILKTILFWLEKRIYKSSAAIVALSPGMAKGTRNILKSHNKEIVIASNSSDTSLFHPERDGSKFKENMGWQGKFVILHFGAMGKANGLDFLIEAAQKLKEKTKLHFVMIGEGRERKRLCDKVNALNLENIEVLGTFPKKQMPEVVAACDISTVLFADFQILEHNSANKFFDSLAAGKPVLLNYSGWQRDKIEEYKCGYGCKQADLDEYTSKLLTMYDDRSDLAVMCQNARKLAETEFDRDLISNRILALIEKTQKEKNETEKK